jgi:hypothetical protein
VTDNGKISVNLKNVPRGVRTTTEGEGLFKSTEVTRQVQMEAAREGPRPAR